MCLAGAEWEDGLKQWILFARRQNLYRFGISIALLSRLIPAYSNGGNSIAGSTIARAIRLLDLIIQSLDSRLQ